MTRKVALSAFFNVDSVRENYQRVYSDWISAFYVIASNYEYFSLMLKRYVAAVTEFLPSPCRVVFIKPVPVFTETVEAAIRELLFRVTQVNDRSIINIF